MKALRQLSAATGKSVAELIRNGMHQYLAGKGISQTDDRINRRFEQPECFLRKAQTPVLITTDI